ncbi:FAD/FMN-containing dehydrogenase [Bryocella elongata]|uniref:FAD/FMN-containing dehydrogenase n=1 Tax=Bryocella elongata TaxID=863522 RepID=A0A1H5UUF0_9BACT|nr:FAD-binding protein [Bryocella elongata]SEF77837.1 FAD/FMN-containing dehydrogenase [Bryocella elongata]
MAIVVSRHDSRYQTLKQGQNLRWPSVEANAAARIVLCENAADAADALQAIVSEGVRPTVRSGGHCYEDFVVNNPAGAILDLSLMSTVGKRSGESVYRIGPGAQLWNAYSELYKRYGATLPAGTCGTVGAGGHITGGGYGLLSRLHGLSCDWLSAVDILTVDAKGTVVPRTASAHRDADLFRACRGGGGGNFGVITSYVFDELPQAPAEVIEAHVRFIWSDTTVERFVRIMKTFGDYWETRGQAPDTWGMFAVLTVAHHSNPGFGMSVQFCNPDGTCNDLTVLNDYLDLFAQCGGVTTTTAPKTTHGQPSGGKAATPRDPTEAVCLGVHTVRRTSWLYATATEAGGPGRLRGKYKSVYMKRGFTEAEARCIYKHMHRTAGSIDLKASMVEIDSYGGAINRPGFANTTAMAQRSSVIKMQPMTFWSDAEDDAAHSTWLNDFYTELYSGPDSDPLHPGTPFPGPRYEGCYINYPDKEMLAYPYWPQLYYGVEGLYPFLQAVKRKYDPNNIFHHAMSIRN